MHHAVRAAFRYSRKVKLWSLCRSETAPWSLKQNGQFDVAGQALRSCSSDSAFRRLYPLHDDFSERHIGPSDGEKNAMLELLGLEVI